ncbi:uncharacterized protein [Nicotiana tomentosiformis]|uniref:uncharacterized protein n=1 Tax=Nicotiana tomentosiformis TaxID=4098 RepID=UPI00388CA315
MEAIQFTCPTGFPFQAMPLRLLLMKWWMQKSKNDTHKLLLDTLPIIIYWNLWKNRCSAKYGSKQSYMIRVVFSINSDIYFLLRANYPSFHWPLQWNELYSTVETMQHHICTSHVTWYKPEDGFVKLNSDSSALNNPCKIGAWAIIRDHLGRFIHAIASPLGERTNNIAEIQASIIGMKWCLENCHFKVHLEADSALLVHWINHESEPHWSLEMQLQKLYLQFKTIDIPSMYKRQIKIIYALAKCGISISDAQSLASVPVTLCLSQGFCKFDTTNKHF